MAYFVELDENNTVTASVVVADHVVTTESAGITYLNKLYNKTSSWKQTYKDGTRKNYAGKGHTYDQFRDAFIGQRPYTSWLLNESTCKWNAPTPYPDDGKMYGWDEPTTSWIEMGNDG
tara:strand:- start:87 stop:440 length:354 start_codon:yes stop_codon:yes gene_type:complete